MMMPLVRVDQDTIRATTVELISNCITNIGIKLTDEHRAGIEDFVAKTQIADFTVGKKAPKKLSEEQLRERESKKAAAKAKKAEEKAKKAEEKAAEKAKKAAEKAKKAEAKAKEKAAKKAAAKGWTVMEITDADGNKLKGQNGASMRVAKKKSSPRGEWPKNQIWMKVPGNWTEEGKARFKELYGEPLDVVSEKKQSDTSSMPDMTAVLAAAAEPVVENEVAEPENTEAVVKSTKTNKKKVDKKAAKAAMKAKAKAKAEAAKAKAKAEAEAEAKVKAEAETKAKAEAEAKAKAAAEAKDDEETVESPLTIDSDGELYSEQEDDDDTPKEWTHDSYDGDETIYKDEDGGVYRYDMEMEEYEIIGYYFPENDTLQFD